METKTDWQISEGNSFKFSKIMFCSAHNNSQISFFEPQWTKRLARVFLSSRYGSGMHIYFFSTVLFGSLNWHWRSRKETVPLSVQFLMLGAHLTIMFIYGKCWILIALSRIFFSCMKSNFCIDSANLLVVIRKL